MGTANYDFTYIEGSNNINIPDDTKVFLDEIDGVIKGVSDDVNNNESKIAEVQENLTEYITHQAYKPTINGMTDINVIGRFIIKRFPYNSVSQQSGTKAFGKWHCYVQTPVTGNTGYVYSNDGIGNTSKHSVSWGHGNSMEGIGASMYVVPGGYYPNGTWENAHQILKVNPDTYNTIAVYTFDNMSPYAISYDSVTNLCYLMDNDTRKIYKWNIDTNIATEFISLEGIENRNPQDICVHNGYIYVADYKKPVIYTYSIDGSLISETTLFKEASNKYPIGEIESLSWDDDENSLIIGFMSILYPALPSNVIYNTYGIAAFGYLNPFTSSSQSLENKKDILFGEGAIYVQELDNPEQTTFRCPDGSSNDPCACFSEAVLYMISNPYECANRIDGKNGTYNESIALTNIVKSLHLVNTTLYNAQIISETSSITLWNCTINIDDYTKTASVASDSAGCRAIYAAPYLFMRDSTITSNGNSGITGHFQVINLDNSNVTAALRGIYTSEGIICINANSSASITYKSKGTVYPNA